MLFKACLHYWDKILGKINLKKEVLILPHSLGVTVCHHVGESFLTAGQEQLVT